MTHSIELGFFSPVVVFMARFLTSGRPFVVKFLIALLLGLCVSVAQAQKDSTIVLYGLLDLGFSYQRIQAGSDSTTFAQPGRAQAQLAMASGQQSGSRWGIKGTQALSNGFQINFVLESGVDVTTGASSGFDRQSTLGIQSEQWGEWTMGRRITPATEAFAGIDPFDFSFGQSSLTSSMGSSFIRFSNLVAYTTPVMNGVSVYGGWSFDTGLRNINAPETAGAFGTSNKFRALSLGFRYEAARFLLAGTYDRFYSPSGKNASAVTLWGIGATYDQTVVKWHAAVGQNIDGLVNGTGALGDTQIDADDADTAGAVLYRPGSRTLQWMLGATIPTGPVDRLFVSIQQQRPSHDFSQGDRSNQTAYSVGYTHGLSKSTDVYAFYSHMTSVAMFNGATSDQFGVGMRHLF